MFISFEGPEGAGKSTALLTLGNELRLLGYQVLCTREPGSGALGARIRNMVLHGEAIAPQTELLLFLADRSNHVASIIHPALQRGEIVLCDRFADSALVYQGFARGLDEKFVRLGNTFATGNLKPDLTLLFDLPVHMGLERIGNKDRLDSEPLEFHEKIREGFLRLAAEEPVRWRVIDARQSQDEVFKAVRSFVLEALTSK